MVDASTKTIQIAEIKNTTPIREISQSHVARLADAMKRSGFTSAVTCFRSDGDGLELAGGAHRLAAAVSAGFTEIPAVVLEQASELEREQITINLNLLQLPLTPAQEALAIARAKQIYETLHPETRQGGDRRSASAKSSRQDGALILPFVDATAEATGRSKRSIERAARRGKENCTDRFGRTEGHGPRHRCRPRQTLRFAG